MKCVTAKSSGDDFAAGEDKQMGRRKTGIARLHPPGAGAQGRHPDFFARLKKIYGGKRLSPTGAKLLSRERSRY